MSSNACRCEGGRGYGSYELPTSMAVEGSRCLLSSSPMDPSPPPRTLTTLTREERCFLISLASPSRAHSTFCRLEGNMVRSAILHHRRSMGSVDTEPMTSWSADCRFCSITPFIRRTGLLKRGIIIVH